jgi:molybdopterin-dependent oxidoreductase alpha subunit
MGQSIADRWYLLPDCSPGDAPHTMTLTNDASHDAGSRMLGAVPGAPALGRGPEIRGTPEHADYHHPAAGWGAAKSVARVLAATGEPLAGPRALVKMNHAERGFDCPGCAWPDDLDGLRMDFCENGVKHLTWELTGKRVDRGFFATHTVAELSQWHDYDLERLGRLTEPMAYDAASDRYIPIAWADAFELVGATLRGLDTPHHASFYTSGRLSNEGSFLYQLFARELGTNNLPDCSNMCHEASGRALRASLGTGKGTVDLRDWDEADLIIVMGVNAASNAPRMLSALAEAHRRGAEIVHINPLVEAAARGTIIPHELARMATLRATPTSTLNIQPRIAGDLALLRGVAKALLEDAEHDHDVLDRVFLECHAAGFEDYRRTCLAASWSELELCSGVSESTMRDLARLYRESKRTIITWCLGITQQEHGVDTVREIVNLLALRGNIGRDGAGPSPVRGHSNVQGNRTCGIDHRPSETFLARLAAACGIDPPTEHGLDTVGTIEAMHRGEVKVFVGMGGNFALAGPDTAYMFQALRTCELTVQVSTKLNRSHLVHGQQALILPCIARSEKDQQRGGVQSITVEDAMSMVHLSTGIKAPISPHLLSEPAIIAGMARAALPHSKVPWQAYVDDYDRIRDTMAQVLDGFQDFNRHARRPNGFRIDQPARERVFLTPSGRMEFSTAALPAGVASRRALTLATVRSHDQWNTTIYSNHDRYRGLRNLRTVVFMNAQDLAERGIESFGLVDITSIAKDGSRRTVYGYRALSYDIPRGSAVGYMPELNVLCPIGDYSEQSDQPLMKHLTVEISVST